MAKTTLQDVIKAPAFFSQHVSQQTLLQADIVQSQAFMTSELLNEIARSASTTATIPFNNNLTGRSQLYTEGTINVDKITSGVQKAVANLRANAWGATDLSSELSGNDKMGAIAERVGGYWAEDLEQTLIFILDGVFASTSMSTNIVNFEYDFGTSLKDAIANALIAAQAKLGKAGKALNTIVCDSQIYGEMQKYNLMSPVRDPSNANIVIERYLGKYDVVVSDQLDANTFYVAGSGSIVFGDGSESLENPTEVERAGLESTSYLINRTKYIVHINGVSFIGTIAGNTPTDVELADGTKWERVFEPENVLLVKVNLSEGAQPV